MYRGRALTVDQLSKEQVRWARQSLQRKLPPHPPLAEHVPPSGRLQVMVWNSGGLAYHDLLQWLQSHSQTYDVIILVETRLAHNMEHMTATHYILHSAQPHAGVMLLIHKRLAPLHRVTWRVLAEGRLVHARLYGVKGHVNIIGFYQQAWQPMQVEQCLKHRAKLLFLGGDFNTDLPPTCPYVGEAVEPHQDGAKPRPPRQPDWQQLQALICKHGLSALNTFQAWSPTYQGRGPQGDYVQSRVDYLYMKHKQVDQTSRHCRYDHDFILTAHRTNAQHSPMFFNTRSQWTPWQAEPPANVTTAKARAALLQCYQHDRPQWEQWSETVESHLRSQPDLQHAISELHRSTRQHLARLPQAHAPRVPSLHQDKLWTTGVANMWGHYRAMRNITSRDVHGIFRAWRHHACFFKASRRFRREARQRKKALIDEFLSEAQECAIRRDTSQWYKRIRHLCPKAKLEKIHLRADDGTLLSPEGSLQALATYYADLFRDQSYTPESLPPLCQVPFSISEIEAAILRLPPRKALLPDLPPAPTVAKDTIAVCCSKASTCGMQITTAGLLQHA